MFRHRKIPSYRVVGGTQMLIDSLASKLVKENILLNTKAVSINEFNNTLQVQIEGGEIFEADKVIICIPPQLISKSISFKPGLPSELNNLLPNVQTWMAGALKFTVEYKSPFWRNLGYSGMLYSHAGIITEMYDHTNYEGNKFGFTGFLNGGAASYSKDTREEFVLKQLQELFGQEVLNPTSYFDKVWTDEFVLAGNQLIQRPHQNNGHHLFQENYMGGKLFFGATETSVTYPGYMEGAVTAANKIVEKITETL